MIFDPYESRRLTGTHASLYRESLRLMLDIYQEGLRDSHSIDHIWVFGVQLFDQLQQSQQMALLITVSNCVLNGVGDSEEWSASEKAAFYAVYRNVYQQLEMELSDFAIVYSYPWPGEDDFHEVVFDRYAERGAVLLQFCGPNDVRPWRKH